MDNDPLFWLYSENYRTYNVDVARKLGSIYAAIFLSHMANRYRYHKNKGELLSDPKYGDNWFFLTQETVEERTCLTRKNQDTSIKILEKFGLIEKKIIGIPSKRYFRINIHAIQMFFFGPGQARLSVSDNLDCPKRTTCDVRNGQPGPGAHTYKEPKEEPKEDTLSTLSNGEAVAASKVRVDECELLFASEIKKSVPGFKIPASKRRKWRAELLAMHEADGKSWDEIKELISYSQSDPFWASRAPNPWKLREHATTIQLQKKAAPIKDNEEFIKIRQEIAKKNYEYAKAKAEKYWFVNVNQDVCIIKNKQGYTPFGYYEDNFKEKLDHEINLLDREISLNET